MGSETSTYTDIQIQRLMSKPEEAYKQYMLEAFKQIRYGMRHVNAHFQTGIIDTRSLYNDGFLKNLGYNPAEKIKYTLLDPALTLSWMRSNISPSVENISAQWRAPSLEELALEYLQDTYSGMILTEKSFLKDGVRWYISGVTSVSYTQTDATCYKDKYATVTKTISPSSIVYIEEEMVVDKGVNCWAVKVTSSATLKYIPVEYTTIQCPGITDAVVQIAIDKYNNKLQTVSYASEPDPETGWITTWDADVRMSVYINNSGDLIVTGVTETHTGGGGWSSSEIKKAAKAMAIAIVRPSVEQAVGEKLERLVAYYTLHGESKIIIAEVKKSLVTTTANARAYPIIPLKQNFSLIKKKKGLEVVLNKIGLNRKDFKDTLADTRIKEAALMFLLELTDTKAASVKAMYETLTNMVKTAGSGVGKSATAERFQLDLKYALVGMTTSVDFTLQVISGSIGPVGKYTTSTKAVQIPYESNGEITTGGEYIKYKVMRKQIAESYYEELVLDPRNSGTVWNVGGYTLGEKKRNHRGGDYTFEGVYIPVTDLGLKSLTYKQLHNVIARSMSLMVLSVVTVKSKWYQTMFFQAIMFVVIVVIIYFTGGILMGMLAFLGLAGVDLGVFGQILTVVMAIYTMGASLAASGYALTTSTLLTGAQTLTSLAMVASDISTKGAMKTLAEKSKEAQAQMAESEKLIDEINENTQQGLWMGIDDRLPDMLYLMSSTEAMCNYDLLYNYDNVMEGMIKSVGV